MKKPILALLFLLVSSGVSAAAEPTMEEINLRLQLIQEQMNRARADLFTGQLLGEHAQMRLKILSEQERELKKKIEAEKTK